MRPIPGARSRCWLVPVLLGATLAPGTAFADEEVAGFLGAFCAAVDRADEEYLRSHLRLPLQLQYVVNEHQGNPRTAKKRLRTVGAVLEARLCEGIDFATARIQQLRRSWLIVAELGQFDVELEVVAQKGRLVLLSYQTPAAHSPPPPPPTQ